MDLQLQWLLLAHQAVIKSAASAASLRSEIGGSGSEKKLCTLPRSKPQNDPINISHAPKRPGTAYLSRPGDPQKNGKQIDEKLSFWAFYIGIKLNFQAVIKSAASAASLRLGERRTTGLGGTTGSDGRRNGFGRRLGALPKPSGRLR